MEKNKSLNVKHKLTLNKRIVSSLSGKLSRSSGETNPSITVCTTDCTKTPLCEPTTSAL